jgi:purine-binding chemotaxis protein CheW
VSAVPSSRVELLRSEFDRSFAEPPRSVIDETESVVAIRVASDAYAVLVTEISGLFADRKIVWVPTPLPELLGVTGLHAGIVPVYSLRALLGLPVRNEAPRWLVAAGGVGLAFDALDGYARVAPSEIARPDGGEPAKHVRATVRVGGVSCSVVSISSVVGEIKRRVAAVEAVEAVEAVKER